MSTTQVPDYTAIRAGQQATWASVDFGVIGATLPIVGELLCEAAEVNANTRVIDVAAGSGTAAIAAARRFTEVVATDYVPELLQQCDERARLEHLDVTTVVAAAEELPFEDASFDVALSTFGVMFAPDQSRAASELVRVVRAGGRIALASWTPQGFIGDLFGVVGSFLPPPPAGVASAMSWGTEPTIAELFGAHASEISCVRRLFMFRYASPEHFVTMFRTYYGPMHRAFDTLDGSGRAALHADLIALLRRHSREDDALVVPAEYLEAMVTRA